MCLVVCDNKLPWLEICTHVNIEQGTEPRLGGVLEGWRESLDWQIK